MKYSRVVVAACLVGASFVSAAPVVAPSSVTPTPPTPAADARVLGARNVPPDSEVLSAREIQDGKSSDYLFGGPGKLNAFTRKYFHRGGRLKTKEELEKERRRRRKAIDKELAKELRSRSSST